MNPIDRMLFDNRPYAKTGTTPPIYVPFDDVPKVVDYNNSYFYLKIVGAQAAFKGAVFQKAKQLVVTSKITLNHPQLEGELIYGIQRTCGVEAGRAISLGWSKNLIAPMPATMRSISVGLSYILDRENQLARMTSLINNDLLATVISFAPGTLMVLKTLGPLAKNIVEAFLPATDSQSILEFTADFNLLGGDLKEGYYVILGTTDDNAPLPHDLQTLTIEPLAAGPRPHLSGQAITQLSYVVLEVKTAPLRGRTASAWNTKLSEAEGLAQELFANPFAAEKECREVWKACSVLLREARALIHADYNYLSTEADLIVDIVLCSCSEKISSKLSPAYESFAASSEEVSIGTPSLVAAASLDPRIVESYEAEVSYSRDRLGIN